MSKNQITIRQSVFVACPAEKLWDFTQDYDNRPLWDSSVLRSELIRQSPRRIVRVFLKGGTIMVFEYKQDDRPFKTSLAATEVKSPFFAFGGGSWQYESVEGGTKWTQTNTLMLKDYWLFQFLKPVMTWMLKQQTARAMRKAKRLVEQINA